MGGAEARGAAWRGPCKRLACSSECRARHQDSSDAFDVKHQAAGASGDASADASAHQPRGDALRVYAAPTPTRLCVAANAMAAAEILTPSGGAKLRIAPPMSTSTLHGAAVAATRRATARGRSRKRMNGCASRINGGLQ